jgi:hypothetical protein
MEEGQRANGRGLGGVEEVTGRAGHVRAEEQRAEEVRRVEDLAKRTARPAKEMMAGLLSHKPSSRATFAMQHIQSIVCGPNQHRYEAHHTRNQRYRRS